MKRATRSNRHAPAHAVFFLLACLLAVAAVPLWTAEHLGWLRGCTACLPPLRHGHEMLLGYAVAVIGGFLFTRLGWPVLILTAAAWLAGRGVAAWDATGWLWSGVALAFPAILMGLAGAPFLKAARSGHNLMFAPILAGFLLAEALYQAGRLDLLAAGEQRGVLVAFDLVTALVLVMGGRIIPAAMAGVLRARGEAMAERNAPRLERTAMAAMAGAAVLHGADLQAWAALGWAVAGGAGALRLRRWRFGASLAMASLWPLQVGYGWLSLGLVAAALAQWSAWWPVSTTLHAATIGGLGVITTVMMVRTVMLRGRISACFPRLALAAVPLLLAAACARLASPLWPTVLLPVAALAWAAALAATGAALATLVAAAMRAGTSR